MTGQLQVRGVLTRDGLDALPPARSEAGGAVGGSQRCSTSSRARQSTRRRVSERCGGKGKEFSAMSRPGCRRPGRGGCWREARMRRCGAGAQSGFGQACSLRLYLDASTPGGWKAAWRYQGALGNASARLLACALSADCASRLPTLNGTGRRSIWTRSTASTWTRAHELMCVVCAAVCLVHGCTTTLLAPATTTLVERPHHLSRMC